MEKKLIVVCPLITFVISFCIGIPDLITQFIYGLVSAILCAVLVWISQKVLSKRAKGDRIIVILSFSYVVLFSGGAHLIVYLMT